MDTILWIAQALLAFAFGMAGIMKVLTPKEKLSENMSWVNDFSPMQVRGIGTLEVLAAVGLILPPVTDILPWLAGLAAVGLILTMIGAAMTHYRRNEVPLIMVNMVLLAIAAFVAVGRLFIEPF